MDEIELIQSLTEQANELPLRDYNRLDGLLRLTRTAIREVFGDSSVHLRALSKIRFYPVVRDLNASRDEGFNIGWLSGKNQLINLFSRLLDELEKSEPSEGKRPLPASNEPVEAGAEASNWMFVLHGHDEAMQEGFARILGQLDMEPVILHEQASAGRTLLENFKDHPDVPIAVVLLSADDLAYPKDRSTEDARLRPCQNVTFELGFTIGKLGKDRVFVLYREDKNFEMPSDYFGVRYIPYDESGRWRFDFIRCLQACGYEVDVNKVL